MNISFTADPTWEVNQLGWPIVPEGLQELLMHVKDTYDNIPVLITENGMAIKEVGGRQRKEGGGGMWLWC